MRWKDEARLARIIRKFEAHQAGEGPALTSSERRQFRKLLARAEGLGRNWRLPGRQSGPRSGRPRGARASFDER